MNQSLRETYKSKQAKLYYILHIVAMVTMMIDHIAVLETNGTGTIYIILRLIGRVAAPLYGYFIFNSFRHTHNKFIFAGRLLTLAVLSEFAYDSMHYNIVTTGLGVFKSQNILFTFFMAFCMLWIIDIYWDADASKKLKIAVITTNIIITTGIGVVCNFDYAIAMIPFIAGLYIAKRVSMETHRQPAYWIPGFYYITANCIRSMFTTSSVNIAWTYALCLFSIILIVAYSVYEDDKIEVNKTFTKINRWFYPVHLYLLQIHMIVTYLLLLLSIFRFDVYQT